MRRRPIGQILVEKEAITEEQLAAALEEQERSGRRLGEILIEQGRTSWLALARALAEQVLDIQTQPAEDPREAKSSHDAVELVREMAERVANLPPVPDPLPPPQPKPVAPTAPEDPERELARAVAEQVANLESPVAAQTRLLRLTPAPRLDDPEEKLHSIEALLKERQRAFIELFTTAETLRMKVARLEEILDERDRELTRLRVLRAS
ncbi:MAG TPA: hypothetical protein VF891_02645 [Gaiellaceae bacterium]